MNELPGYDALPVRSSAPPGSSWGVWADDRLGTTSLFTAENVLRARASIRTGRVFPLDLELDEIDPPLFEREGLQHEVRRNPSGSQDDLVHRWNTQSSTQWDGFRHMAHPEYGYYGGVANGEHGIDLWASRGMVGGAVVADIAAWRHRHGRPALRWGERDVIESTELRDCLVDQGTTVHPGDVLLVRTGWVGWYLDQDADYRAEISRRGSLRTPGLAPDESMVELLWDLHISAVAADNPALEAWPPQEGRLLHHALLSLLGLPIGELWRLDDLAADCAADGTWDCFVTSAPLRIRGGVGSPANAIAVR